MLTSKDMFAPKEVARLHGVSTDTILREIHAGRLKARFITRRTIRITGAAVEAWVRATEQAPVRHLRHLPSTASSAANSKSPRAA